jgi:hypothetical protein
LTLPHCEQVLEDGNHRFDAMRERGLRSL